MKSEKGLETLFVEGLKDLYYAEKKILKTLPKLAKAAESEQVSAAFEKHRMETERQVERLEQVFEQLGKPARGKTCPAIDGILEEGSEVLEEYKGAPALDAGLVGAAQAVEHYEIARYGTLIGFGHRCDWYHRIGWLFYMEVGLHRYSHRSTMRLRTSTGAAC
ncbi:DUF892 family protein [Mesorhizobium sp. M4B.F.Ca.ET.013.02.1.1]|uniref:YciE/YciF ferroxidase family protein n=1 Tax=Mesorhizobium sp. M4B.F.Ca.ET.013.02.1.1 TaxID=2496755 RepID=UPI001672CCCD|nr:DUF892 family protein [Mesorhizobium sp. M4B.F.Ca.ET.013.02.1.1]